MSDDEVLAILSNLDTRKLSTRFISQNQDLNTPTARILLNIILIAVVSAILKHTYSLDRLVQQVGNAIFNLGILQPTLHIELNAKFFKFRSFVFIVSAGHASASHELFYSQLGVKLCSMAGGGVQKIYMVFLREPSRRDRSGSDLFHLRDGFEIKMNFDRNVSCFIFVNALMHDDFFD